MTHAPFLFRTLMASLLILVSSAIAVPAARAASPGETIAAAADRSAEDRKADVHRHPAQFLDFAGVKPGMVVLDMMAGGGYTTELLARAVGEGGTVLAQSFPGSSEKSRLALAERLTRPSMAHVVRVETPIEAPVPDGRHDLDLITLIQNYHDITYMPVDRAKMVKAMFDGLKPGGALVVIDHAAKAGDGATVGKSLHRIEEATLIAEIEAGGFKKEAEADFLRQPGDAHDQPSVMMDGTSDRFVLRFRKPSR